MQKITKTKKEIQRKWDSILCRCLKTKIRHREAYYDIARYAIGERFTGNRRDLHMFVVSLELDRMVEFTKWKNKIGQYAKDDFRLAIAAHCKEFIDDLFAVGPPFVLIDIVKYKWRDLSSKREMLQERRVQESCHTYASKSSIGNCSDWQRVK